MSTDKDTHKIDSIIPKRLVAGNFLAIQKLQCYAVTVSFVRRKKFLPEKLYRAYAVVVN